VFVATADGTDDDLLGYAMVELVDDHAHLEPLSVLPEHGRKGIGTQLLDAVAEWARNQGHGEVTLTTFRDLPFNAPLYARRGYEVVPEDEWTDALRELVAHEATLGLDPSARVVMRRPLS
jgi:GNAT superfamily N-acetyltransferase